MFTKYKKTPPTQHNNYDEGQRLFKLGVAAAHREDFNGAIDFYSRSIVACPNPVPYLNRARILVKKIRYQEALNDLMDARRTDEDQGSEFLPEIEAEIQSLQYFTQNYKNGTREKFIEDFRQNSNSRYIARRIFCTSFKVEIEGFMPYNSPLVEYHFFNELDNIKRFENLSDYPEADEFLQIYPYEFIQKKIEGPVDSEAYKFAESILHMFLCSYDEKEMRYLRREIIYDIHERLLDRDYGAMGHGTMTSEVEITREAAEFKWLDGIP